VLTRPDLLAIFLVTRRRQQAVTDLSGMENGYVDEHLAWH
jgi:hypothetical protein